MDAFLLVGQSNMAGRGYLSKDNNNHNKNNENNKTIINGHEILSFSSCNKWISAHDPLHYDKPDKCGVGPGLSFAKLIASLDVVNSNRKIGLIPCAIGGTSISEWLPSDDNNDNGIFEKTIQKCILALNTKFECNNNNNNTNNNIGRNKKLLRKTKNGSLLSSYQSDDDELKQISDDDNNNNKQNDIELKGILWHQGESDCDEIEKANEYLSNSIIVFNKFRECLNNDNIPIIVGGLGEFLGKNKNKNLIYYNIINTSLMSLPQRLHNFGYVSSSNLNHRGDFLHFDTESNIILGQRYAAKYAKLSGSLTNEELNKYMRFNQFKNVLKKNSRKAYEKTKGISFKTWLLGIAITCCAIYAYKGYYASQQQQQQQSDKKKE